MNITLLEWALLLIGGWIAATVSGASGVGGTLPDSNGGERDGEGSDIGQHVGGVGKKGEAPREYSADHLRHEIRPCQAQGDDELSFVSRPARSVIVSRSHQSTPSRLPVGSKRCSRLRSRSNHM